MIDGVATSRRVQAIVAELLAATPPGKRNLTEYRVLAYNIKALAQKLESQIWKVEKRGKRK
jgi:hypothetical protein